MNRTAHSLRVVSSINEYTSILRIKKGSYPNNQTDHSRAYFYLRNSVECFTMITLIFSYCILLLYLHLESIIRVKVKDLS